MTTRRFTLEDCQRFAAFSGDYNPLHIDPSTARRSLFGSTIVHGVLSVLWALDEWLRQLAIPVSLTQLEVSFDRPVKPGDLVFWQIHEAPQKEESARIDLRIDHRVVTRMHLHWKTNERASTLNNGVIPGIPERFPCRSLDRETAQVESGKLPLFFDRTTCRDLFPAVEKLLPPRQTAAILTAGRLVGMTYPGLHSLFSKLELCFPDAPQPEPEIRYEVTRMDPRFGAVLMDLTASGLAGTIQAFFRPRPREQAAPEELDAWVDRSEFAGQRALVAGGSRGLGEVTAKLLARGGAEVVITYHQGEEDARRVVREITSAGGTAQAARWNASDAEANLPGFLQTSAPTHLYFFATPHIASGARGVFSSEIFRTFCGFYVEAFLRLVAHCDPETLEGILYPSTVFAGEIPPNMGEYAAAKAAGEVLCQHLEKSRGIPVLYPRLPKLATDQTAGLLAEALPDPAPVLIHYLRELRDRSQRR